MRVFISHPCSDNVPLRREQNRALIERLQTKHPDVLFISPLLLFDYLDSDGELREEIMDTCEVLIGYASDEMWQRAIPGVDSEGCNDEKAMAEAAGIPVRFIDENGDFIPDKGERNT